ncbi:hypothetical protein QBC33DRAFT_341255 [Phialemonium atrogriseum]|uniref:Uncharacterized protein n=1 Tax=Phialemonium atrogriseum TaxID=1093897 RepID=A0AAJ0C7F7_9PEZI|nr:uncharacterized protein QBC33DRAFT_341255 [Phialemonium atrogriseum]KAK1769086.1 hypothetical protein QBC33DRAFT_341255 [Phialemonium atrogriseum]
MAVRASSGLFRLPGIPNPIQNPRRAVVDNPEPPRRPLRSPTGRKCGSSLRELLVCARSDERTGVMDDRALQRCHWRRPPRTADHPRSQWPQKLALVPHFPAYGLQFPETVTGARGPIGASLGVKETTSIVSFPDQVLELHAICYEGVRPCLQCWLFAAKIERAWGVPRVDPGASARRTTPASAAWTWVCRPGSCLLQPSASFSSRSSMTACSPTPNGFSSSN